MEINWTVLTYFVIGLFALSGFFKGWWKEAITTVFLAVLVFLLQNPTLAQLVIDTVNNLLLTVWEFIPQTLLPTVDSSLEAAFAVETRGRALQADAGNPGTWLIILIVLAAIATLLGRSTLPNRVRGAQGIAYPVTPTGSVLGGLIGGLNGFLIINLIREYLDGRNLPATGAGLPTEIAMAGSGQALGRVSSGVAFQASQVPDFTILDSFLPWVFIGFGLLFLLVVLRSRVGLHSKNGFRRINYKVPYGYAGVKYKKEG